jgi:hypothetical protein
MAEFAYGDPDVAIRLLRNITQTIETGTLGAYKELIPEGLSFMQLWSPAIYLQGMIEGIFGLQPWADEDLITISPKVPTEWKHAKVEELRVGDHSISIFFEREKVVEKGTKSTRDKAKSEKVKDATTTIEKTSVEYITGRGKLRCCLKLAVPQGRSEPEVRINRAEETMFVQSTCCETERGRQYVSIEFELEQSYRVEATYRDDWISLDMVKVGEMVTVGGPS